MKKIKFNKKNSLLIFLLILLLFGINKLIFGPQLNYGFRDVDWEMLYYYNFFGNLSLNHFLQSLKLMGAYTYELYYVGFLEKILGLNFTLLHQATQLFKVIAGLSIYILVWKIFKRKLLAFLTSLIYTISYTHAGSLFMLSTGGYFFATIFMSGFLLTYYYVVTQRYSLRWIVAASTLLTVTLILNTERMYPLILLVLLLELTYVVFKKFKRNSITLSIRRILIILLPIIVFSLIYVTWLKSSILNTGFSPNQFFIGVENRVISVLNGNWQLLLYPFASLGSMFLDGDYWKLLGQTNLQTFVGYISSLIFGPVLKLGLATFFLLSVIYQKPFKLTLIIAALIFIFGLIIYGLFSNWQHINPQVRIHFDPNLVTMPALFGFYILILSCVLFIKWIKNGDRNLSPLVGGISFTVLFIFLTWVASDIQLIFIGPQRYLSIPSIGTSLFISGILVMIFDKLQKINITKQFAWIIFLVLIPLTFINYQIANNFFNYELDYVGMRGKDQTEMKAKFRTLIADINRQDKSLFYFDETADKNNGYFDESVVLAGFEFWTRVNADGTLNNFPEPGMMRTNVQCHEHTHESCMKMLKDGLTARDGVPGILYKDVIKGQTEPRFYKLSNFYAIRFINKDLIDIRKEVFEELKVADRVEQ